MARCVKSGAIIVDGEVLIDVPSYEVACTVCGHKGVAPVTIEKGLIRFVWPTHDTVQLDFEVTNGG